MVTNEMGFVGYRHFIGFVGYMYFIGYEVRADGTAWSSLRDLAVVLEPSHCQTRIQTTASLRGLSQAVPSN